MPAYSFFQEHGMYSSLQNGVPIEDFKGHIFDTSFLCGTYVSVLRDASKLHDVRQGITDEFRYCVGEEDLSLFMSVCSNYVLCLFECLSSERIFNPFGLITILISNH